MKPKNKDKKKTGLGGIILMVLMLLSQFAGEDGFIALIIVLALFVIGASVYVMLKAAKKLPAVPKKREPCEFGKINHEFSHDAGRRMIQLEGFYKDGLIDRGEYEFLKERWSKN